MSRILDKVKRGATKFVGDVRAVSPVIAVLILVIVAVVGGIAVGMLQTGITEQTEEKAQVGDIGVHKIKVIGGPGVTPLMAGYVPPGESITSDNAPGGTILHVFAEANPDIEVEFLRECCGFAMYALSQGACDMGIGRRFPTAPELAAYPELQYQVVGKVPIAVIANAGAFATSDNKTTYTELNDTFMAGSGDVAGVTVTAVAYAFDPSHGAGAEWMGGEATAPEGEVYGTSIQGMFSLYLMRGPSADAWILGGAEDNLKLNEAILGGSWSGILVNTPEQVIEEVATNTTGNPKIGFVDYRYAVNYMEENPGEIVILGLDGLEPDLAPEAIGTADTSNAFGGPGYVTGFGGPMFTPVMVFTNGEPNPYVQKLIDSMTMFEGVEVMHEHGVLAGEDIVVSATCPFHTA
ncbi:MAG TPA: hypothetical protein ENI32_03370 [Candidatus Syntrophoarchaeum butanivorans]|uniref:Uncharacterized protein n=1 Tax=Candidatus Syntropharchaeum butanivorans TaxID=1839936 RepID=A0A7J2S2R3_9EURY|nr:hypothetical protein [Candidatus Syntrophoarchaeum butanivorans]